MLVSFSTYLQEGLQNPAMISDKEVRKFEALMKSPRVPDDQKLDMLVSIYDKYQPVLDKVMSKFQNAVKKEIRGMPKVKFMANTKPFESIKDKALTRGKGFMGLNDLVRGAVLFDTKEQADEFVSKFSRRNANSIVEYEEKERGGDTDYGYYGSHHLGMNIDGIIVEIQVMTRKLWNYKKAAHKIYTATRSKKGGPDRFDTSQSKKIFSLGNRPGYVKDDWNIDDWEVILENDEYGDETQL